MKNFTIARWQALFCNQRSLQQGCKVHLQLLLAHQLLADSRGQPNVCLSDTIIYYLLKEEKCYKNYQKNMMIIPSCRHTCGENIRKKGSLSGFIIKRPNNSAEAQCQAFIGDPNIPMTAWTARFSLFHKFWKQRGNFPNFRDRVQTTDMNKLIHCCAYTSYLTSFWCKTSLMSWISEGQAAVLN